MRNGSLHLLLALALPGCAGDDAGTAQRAHQLLGGWLPAQLALPADGELHAQLTDALELRVTGTDDRALDALEPGELREHATLTQQALDRGIFGLDAMFAVGDELFEFPFGPADGLGNDMAGAGIAAGARPAPNLRRVHDGDFGGPDAHACVDCHSRGGPDGAGTSTQNAFLRGDGDRVVGADQRNAPHLLGLGPIEALATEMSAALAALRDAALAEAAAAGVTVEVALQTKGVSFGVLRAHPDGGVDTAAVDGVDGDLIIKPFGWKGHSPTIRAMAEESFRIHLGVVSMRVQQLIRDGLDPTPYGAGAWWDVDGDGVSIEVEDGMLTTMVAYLAQLEVPVIRPPAEPRLLAYFARGSTAFDSLGCASCHRRELTLIDPVLITRPEQPDHADRPPVHIDVASDGEHPKIAPRDVARTSYSVNLFSDLRRHDMGPALATPGDQDGIAPSVFLTRPLWGLAETAPYLHDGRAPTLHDAIVLHGGEAAAARDAYLAADPEDQRGLRVFLRSLSRTPRVVLP